jgi:hypothetical protein
MNIGGWSGNCEDWLHGDEHLSDDSDYPPMKQWEIDEALADIKAKEMREVSNEKDTP